MLREELNRLSSHLIALHKGLLDYQLKESQEQDAKKYAPYEALDKVLKDQRFQWLRPLSLLISRLDEHLSIRNRDKPLDPAQTIAEIIDLLDGKNKEFVGRYSLALVADPRITINEAEVRQSLSQVRKVLKK